MDVRLTAAIAGGLEGVNKAGLAREIGISRSGLYRAKGRYEAEGLAGLEDRSRRPKSSPNQTSDEMEDLLVRTRKELLDEGLDAGPWSIHARLIVDGVRGVPHPSTIWRRLTKRGLITPEPNKRPKVSLHRFEAGRPNELWQTDATHTELADGTSVEIINVVDDHSRVCIAATAVVVTTAARVWQTLARAIATWGPPQRILSDNGAPFVAGSVTENLAALGINRSRTRPHHPQTNGKVERFHKTQQQWLDARPSPASLRELQALLDEHAEHYNTVRCHSAAGRRPPIIRFQATPPAIPIGVDITDEVHTGTYTVSRSGTIPIKRRWDIGVGVRWAGATVTVIVQGTHAAVFCNDQLVRQLTLDPTRRYQPSGNKRGGPRQPRPDLP